MASEKRVAKRTTAKAKEPGEKATKAKSPRRRRAPSHDAIAKRAYELYQVQGGGDDVAHWLQAERELAGS